jgi:hypothetical protein
MDVWTKDGKKHHIETRAARGSAANPLKDGEIEDKLLAEAANWQSGHDVKPLIDAVWTLERLDDVGRLLKLATPR